jgi:amidohydrolase
MPHLTDTLRTDMVGIRRDLHRHPEISHQEHRTAGIVADRLDSLGLKEIRTGVGGTGVVALLRGGRPGPTVMLRADMDALPLVEADRGQPYRSEVEGAHHACGHDGHVAILLTAARILREREADLPGTVSFLFQPAEERVGGAQGMLDEGALEDPRPDACFALHLWNTLPLGQIGVRPGAVFANADHLRITLSGPGGHGAEPHQTSDPVVAVAYLITALQTLVSRETPPLSPSALTIGSIHGGTAPNIIPSRIELQGTLRTFDDALRTKLLRRINDLVQDVSHMFHLTGEFHAPPGCDACVNDAGIANLVRDTVKRLFGQQAVSDSVMTTGADDMSVFLQAVPGCYYFVGSANPSRGLDSPHHSPTFDFDEAALDVGVEMMVQTALDALSRPRPAR